MAVVYLKYVGGWHCRMKSPKCPSGCLVSSVLPGHLLYVPEVPLRWAAVSAGSGWPAELQDRLEPSVTGMERWVPWWAGRLLPTPHSLPLHPLQPLLPSQRDSIPEKDPEKHEAWRFKTVSWYFQAVRCLLLISLEKIMVDPNY